MSVLAYIAIAVGLSIIEILLWGFLYDRLERSEGWFARLLWRRKWVRRRKEQSKIETLKDVEK